MKLSVVIEIVKGPARGKIFNRLLEPGEDLTVGRMTPVDVWLPKASVSRRHCTMTNRDGALELTDHASNSTILNGHLIDGVTPLASGDMLQVGTFHLHLEIQQEDALLFSSSVSTDELLHTLSGENETEAEQKNASVFSTGNQQILSPRVGQVVAGYALRYPIGEGATSEVFLGLKLSPEVTQLRQQLAEAEDAVAAIRTRLAEQLDNPAPRERVAIKIFQTEPPPTQQMLHRFAREARVLAQLDHPNIVKVLGSDEQDGEPYLICEYLQGRTLHALLKVLPVLTPGRALEIAQQLADALSYAANKDIIHRDVNPRNVFIRSKQRKIKVKLIDFGLAKQIGDMQVTLPGEGFGTLGYMSPEQLVEASSADIRSDIYGLGAIIFRMIAGEPHKSAKTLSELLEQINQTTPSLGTVAPGCPPTLVQLVDRCLAVDPAQRFQNYEALLSKMAKSHQLLADRSSG